jgi:oligopeptide transport system substrate-binding protein
MKRYFYYILPLLLLIAACNNGNNNSGKTVFNINMDEGLTSMDPAFSRNQNAMWAVNQVFNGLVQINDSLQTTPCIAKSWEVDSSDMIYTFHLRNDVYFHDDPLFTGG